MVDWLSEGGCPERGSPLVPIGVAGRPGDMQRVGDGFAADWRDGRHRRRRRADDEADGSRTVYRQLYLCRQGIPGDHQTEGGSSRFTVGVNGSLWRMVVPLIIFRA